MLYLNTLPESAGGTTNMLTQSTSESASLVWREAEQRFTRPPGMSVRSSIAPKAGRAIVFNHNMLHEGGPLHSGTKWILRTELMFKQTVQVHSLCNFL